MSTTSTTKVVRVTLKVEAEEGQHVRGAMHAVDTAIANTFPERPTGWFRYSGDAAHGQYVSVEGATDADTQGTMRLSTAIEVAEQNRDTTAATLGRTAKWVEERMARLREHVAAGDLRSISSSGEIGMLGSEVDRLCAVLREQDDNLNLLRAL